MDNKGLIFYKRMADTSTNFPLKYCLQIPSFGIMEDASNLVHVP